MIIVTGGAGFLGKSFVEAILKNNGLAVIADMDQSGGCALQEELAVRYPGGKATFLPLDITSGESVRELIRETVARFGRIDALVNNAYPRNANYGRDLEQVTPDDFNENIGLHLGGYFLTMQQLSLFFRNQGYGTVINIASVYGIVPPRFGIYEHTGFTMPVEYAAIKSAIIHLTRYFAAYYKGKNIRFNCISPGGVYNNHEEGFRIEYSKHTLNKGMLDPSDLTGTLVFLLSEQSTYINGQNIIVDDGFTL